MSLRTPGSNSELVALHQILEEVDLSQFATKIIEDLQVLYWLVLHQYYMSVLNDISLRSHGYLILTMSQLKI